MSGNPTHADAELIVKLYDLRREAELRKARAWVVGNFWPQTADDVLSVIRAGNTQENAWFRMVGGYWGMVASFVLNGVLNEKLFLETSFSGEMFLIYAKMAPFIPTVREKMQNPNFMMNFENIMKLEAAKPRLEGMAKNIENMRKSRLEAKAS